MADQKPQRPFVDFPNPFRPGAGHMPPFLAGREEERETFSKLLDQDAVMANPLLTGLRRVGKTVLLETFKPLAESKGWLWIGADMSESASISEANLLTRLITDIAVVTYSFTALSEQTRDKPSEDHLDSAYLMERCNATPGLMSDKMRAILELVHSALPSEYRGAVFAYDEAQNLTDHRGASEYPLSVLLESFQSVQKKGVPFMLLLTGLPTLFPKLVDARTYSERMFRVLFLQRLDEKESKEAIQRPVAVAKCPVRFTDGAVDAIWHASGGYPFFIQYICREMFDIYLSARRRGEQMNYIPMEEILRRLDNDFFAGRWAHVTDRQRSLLHVIANLPNADGEFSVKEIAEASKDACKGVAGAKAFSSSHINQMLASLASKGMVFKNRYGRYSFAVPLLEEFIQRQDED